MRSRQFCVHRAFTLVEVLVATAILTFLLVLLTSLLSSVSKAWTAGEQQAAKFQDGRAILELLSRELSQASISPNLQFIHDPSLNGTPQRTNSDCIFWQAPVASTSQGKLAEVGYYLSEDLNRNGADAYQLKRFYVPPDDATNYQIFSVANRPTDNSAPWLSNYVTNANLSTTVASGVLAFWVRCLDRNGDPIPWPPTYAGGRFNSAAHFQPATPNTSSSPSFRYTDPNTTAQAHVLPSFVELTLITLDPLSFQRHPTIPAVGAQNNANSVPTVRDAFNQQLIANNIRTARTFTTIVRLANGVY